MITKSVRAAVIEKGSKERVARAQTSNVQKKPSRAEQHARLIGNGVPVFSEDDFIQQVNGFGTPMFSKVSSSAGV